MFRIRKLLLNMKIIIIKLLPFILYFSLWSSSIFQTILRISFWIFLNSWVLFCSFCVTSSFIGFSKRIVWAFLNRKMDNKLYIHRTWYILSIKTIVCFKDTNDQMIEENYVLWQLSFEHLSTCNNE